jgi:uncharacterized damage-inducible protein DinB
MKSKFEKQLQELETIRKQKIEQLQTVDRQLLQRSPGNGGWSVAQVFQHLYEAEAGSIGYLNKKIQSEDLPSAGLATHFRMLLLNVMLSGKLKFKAPATVSSPENRDFDEVIKSWDTLRDDLRLFLDKAPEQKLARALYRHPVVGRLTMSQTLKFFQRHMLHHWKQVDRVLAEVTSSTSAN